MKGRFVSRETREQLRAMTATELAEFRARNVGVYSGLVAAADEEIARRR